MAYFGYFLFHKGRKASCSNKSILTSHQPWCKQMGFCMRLIVSVTPQSYLLHPKYHPEVAKNRTVWGKIAFETSWSTEILLSLTNVAPFIITGHPSVTQMRFYGRLRSLIHSIQHLKLVKNSRFFEENVLSKEA